MREQQHIRMHEVCNVHQLFIAGIIRVRACALAYSSGELQADTAEQRAEGWLKRSQAVVQGGEC